MRNILYALTCLLFSQLASAQGGSVSGGNSIHCRPSADNALDGVYALDFVATGIDASDLAPVTGVEESLTRIGRIIYDNRYTLPYLSYLFDTFKADLYNTTDPTRPNYWEAVASLPSTQDQRIDHTRIPANCKVNGVADAQQAFVRHGSWFSDRGTETTTYRFIPSELDAMARSGALQVSMLLVHEWLWHVSFDVVLNRKINRFLHSSEISGMNHNQVRARLGQMGLDFTRLGLADDERTVFRGTTETDSFRGATTDLACLEPRREYARHKLETYRLDCQERVPAGHVGRIVTINYRETNGCTSGRDCYCFVNWTWVCAASPAH